MGLHNVIAVDENYKNSWLCPAFIDFWVSLRENYFFHLGTYLINQTVSEA